MEVDEENPTSENLLMMEEDNDSMNQDEDLSNPAMGDSRKRKLNVKLSKAKKFKKEKMAPPSAEEMIQLKETENLFKSNLFRLEIEEITKEIKPLKMFRSASKMWLQNFKKFAMELESLDDKSLNDLSWLEEYGVCLPLPANERPIKGHFKFLPPVDVKPVGSFNAGCLMGPKFNVDVAVIIPRTCFFKKDYLNHTYHVKRALYLCVLCGMLKKSDLVSPESKMEFWTPSGDSLKPILVLSPNGKAAGHVEVFIHAIPEQGCFDASHFAPHTNNIRNDWWGIENAILGLQPTPFYNNSILEDVIMESNEALRAEAYQDNDNIREALLLLRVWLRQRDLDQGYGCFSPYLMSMLIIYLKDHLKLNKFMSSYQIIRNVWLYLSTADWTKQGISLSKADIETVPAISVFHGYHEVVFIDQSGYCNLTARMSRLTFLKVKHESGVAIQYLDNANINGFQALFMVKMPFIRQYDHFLCFNDNETLLKAVNENTCTGSQADFNNHPVPQFVYLMSNLLIHGLTNRATQVAVLPYQMPRWGVDAECLSNRLCEVLLFGIKLEPEKAVSIIELGPAGNLPEAEDFREMWQGKYELRRFKDGTICEAVVWGEPEMPLQERMMITRKIVNYLLKNKLNIEEEKYLYIADQLNPVLTPSADRELSCDVVSANVHKSLEDLTSILIGMSSLPLNISSVFCISPVYRYTDVHPPLIPPSLDSQGDYVNKNNCRILPPSLPDNTVPPFVPTIDLVAEMAFSRRWPNDLSACRRLTAAFYIAISRQLDKHNIKYILHSDCLIIRKDDFMFRMYLGYSKEIALLKMKISKDGFTQYRDNPESIEMEKKFINLPKITGALHGLSVQWPSFGATARLAKRWISSQMMDESHFPPVLTELIVASLYLNPEPYSPALQPLTMFLRFLSVLSMTNWHIEPLIVNFNNTLTREEIRLIEIRFNKERSKLPPMFVVTPYDPSGSLWTKEVPTLTTLVRLASLASTSLQILEVSLISSKSIEHVLPIFNPAMHVYDAVIQLKQSMVARSYQRILCQQSYQPSSSYSLLGVLPITRFDPAQLYLNELRDHYGSFALFFYDEYGGSNIGVLFKPSIFEPSEFSIPIAGGRKPTCESKDKPLEINLSAILSDFRELGRGVVENLTLSKKLSKYLNRN